MERAAFARALQFLSYSPLARLGAIMAGVGTSILFVALLVVLALFTDLVISRGAIPCFHELPTWEKHSFYRQYAYLIDVEGHPPPQVNPALNEEWRQDLRTILVEEARIQSLLSAKTNDPSPAAFLEFREAVLWLAKLPALVQEQVGEEAAESVRQELRKHFQKWGPEAAAFRNLENYGLLSLVVRTKSSLPGALIAPMARWAGWTWRDGNQTYLHGLFFWAVLLGAVRAGLQFLAGVLAARVVIEAVTRLRRALCQHSYRLGALAFRPLGANEAVAISHSHLTTVQDGLLAWLTHMYRVPVKCALLLGFAMLVNFWLALAFLLFAVLVWIVGGQIAAYFRGRGRLAESRAADHLALLDENLLMLRLVKAFQMETFHQARLEQQLTQYADAQMERHRGEAIYRPTFLLLGLSAALTLLLVMGIVILHGHLGVASAVILVTALVCLYWPVSTYLATRRLLRRCRQSAKAMFDFLDRHGSVAQDLNAEFLPALSRQLDLDKVFLREPGTGHQLLQGVSLTLPAGQKIALVGPDDQEKHALVYLLPRFLDPGSGALRIDKKDLRSVTLDSLRAQIALVLQQDLVFNDTVANNIGCGDDSLSLARITEAAKVAHAHQFIQKLPKGYETLIGDMGQVLEVGEMFRIALARSILRDPALVVIEEPITPLDDDTKSLIDDTYTRFLTGRTVIFLPHRLSTIRRCDQVYLLHQGKIEAHGEHRELLAKSDLYRHLQYLEFNEYASLRTEGAPGPIQLDRDS